MIKAENSPKFPKNPRNLPEKSPQKTPKNGGVRLSQTGEFCQFFREQGVLADHLIGHACY